MLSQDQRDTIYKAVKKSYAIKSKSFNPSIIYTNQELKKYPSITLSYPDEEVKAQNSVGNQLPGGSTGQRCMAMLSVNIFAKGDQGLNAYNIAQQIAAQAGNDIRKNWGNLANGIKFLRKTQTKDLTGLFREPGVDTARMQFDVFLSYDITW